MNNEELQQLALLLQAQLDAKTPAGIKTRINVMAESGQLRIQGFDDGIYDADLVLICTFGKDHGLNRFWIGPFIGRFEIHLFNGEK